MYTVSIVPSIQPRPDGEALPWLYHSYNIVRRQAELACICRSLESFTSSHRHNKEIFDDDDGGVASGIL